MATHAAVVTVGIRKPLAIQQAPTVTPGEREIRVRQEWVASTPLDLHQNDGGLLVTPPQTLGNSVSGTVVEVGSNVNRLAIGDKVFGFAWRNGTERGYQEYVTTDEYLLAKVPSNVTLPAAATVPDNFVTAWHTLTTHFPVKLPWPRPTDHSNPHTEHPILIWGASSSVGQYALQILKYYGYRNVLATASKKHHDYLKSVGAAQTFDYRDAGVEQRIVQAIAASSEAGSENPAAAFILDCIGSKEGSLAPIAKVAQAGSKVALMLPVIVRDATDDQEPEYAMDPTTEAEWQEGVVVEGVRTHFYLENEFAKQHLQSEIMPALLEQGVITPQRQKIVEGKTLLERAQKALDHLRRREVSGERLVWRIAEAESA